MDSEAEKNSRLTISMSTLFMVPQLIRKASLRCGGMDRGRKSPPTIITAPRRQAAPRALTTSEGDWWSTPE